MMFIRKKYGVDDDDELPKNKKNTKSSKAIFS